MHSQSERNAILADALESGRYFQTKGKLRNGDFFDCLGVACEVFRLTTGRGEWLAGGEFALDGDYESELPPLAVAEWYGWSLHDVKGRRLETDQNPVLQTPDGQRVSAADMNDTGYSFSEIGQSFRALAR